MRARSSTSPPSSKICGERSVGLIFPWTVSGSESAEGPCLRPAPAFKLNFPYTACPRTSPDRACQTPSAARLPETRDGEWLLIARVHAGRRRRDPAALDGLLLRAHCKRRRASAGNEAGKVERHRDNTSPHCPLAQGSREIPSGPPPEFLMRVCAMSAKEEPVQRRRNRRTGRINPTLYFAGLMNLRVKRSLSPMAVYFARSLSPSA